MRLKSSGILLLAGIAGGFGINERFTNDIPTHVIAKHQHYTSYYNIINHEPDSVSWDLTPEMVSCADKPQRKNLFDEDPEIQDTYKLVDSYKGSDYDKGHLFSYADASCDSTDQMECFYMSNMLPQSHYLNAGKWSVLEDSCRIWAKTQVLHIIAGGIGNIKTIGSGNVVVPKYCYKAVLINGAYQCWRFPNDQRLPSKMPLDSCKIDKATIDQETGLNL